MFASSQQRFGHLINAERFESMQPSVGDVADGCYFPPEFYTSEEWFAFEKEAIYSRSWLCVGRADFLKAPGDYFTVTINDDPLLVVMDDEEQIRVMSAVCQHRGHLLAEDAGHKETGLFRCPLHFWSFDLRGRLRHAPEMNRTNNFNRDEICLPQLSVEVWQGFVFAHFEPDPPPLAPTLTQLADEMANYGVSEMVSLPTMDIPDYPWNWKVMLENFMEPYHNAFLHKGIHDFALGHGFVEHTPDENVIMHPTGFDRADGAFNPLHKALLPPIPTLTEDQRNRVMFAMIPPMMPLGLVPDHMFYFLVLPGGANRITIRVGLCVPPEALQVRNFGKIIDWIVDGIMMYNDQDVVADTAVQKGLRSRFAPRGRFSWKETTVAQLNRWLYERYRAYAESHALL
ncbi:MAG: aromatic ring-hydroxylating dioxygenase subunit alpha [Acidimicrobiia bacterium]|nr:aromatic ring-hydroxylating dioxygenase subunit alpha [Acidimicrobiia bacterium]